VLQRHQLDAATFYRSQRHAKAAVLAALGEKARGQEDGKDRENERKSRIVALVVEETSR
jgi:hypothetical protein